MKTRRNFVEFFMQEKHKDIFYFGCSNFKELRLFDERDYDWIRSVDKVQIDNIYHNLKHIGYFNWYIGDADICPHCIAFNYMDCSSCQYGKNHGICNEGISNYSYIRNNSENNYSLGFNIGFDTLRKFFKWNKVI